MDENKILLLSQLFNILSQNVTEMESAYADSNKEKFDNAREIVLEAQKKIAFILKEVD